MSLEDLAGHAKGLVAMTGCMGGLVPQAILEEGEARGRETLAALRDAIERWEQRENQVQPRELQTWASQFSEAEFARKMRAVLFPEPPRNIANL